RGNAASGASGRGVRSSSRPPDPFSYGLARRWQVADERLVHRPAGGHSRSTVHAESLSCRVLTIRRKPGTPSERDAPRPPAPRPGGSSPYAAGAHRGLRLLSSGRLPARRGAVGGDRGRWEVVSHWFSPHPPTQECP